MGRHVKTLLFLAFCVLLLPIFSAIAAEDRDAIVREAKKERLLIYYSITNLRDGTALVHSFQKKYPFIEPRLFRLGSTAMAVKILQEHRAGAHLFDVFSAYSFQLYEIFKEGLFQKYDSPERAAFLEDFKDKEGFWTSIYHSSGIIAYNSNLVKPVDVPKSYDDLLHPKWKGLMLMDDREAEWYANMLQILGREKGLDFMRSLAKQNLNFRSGRALITQLLAAGEFPLAVNATHHTVQSTKERGAPVESVAAYPTISRIEPIALGRYAPHPNVGKLFIDFVLSEEGQKILRSFGRSSSRKGIEPDELQKKGVKLYVGEMSLAKDYAQYDKEFKEIFGLK